MHASIFPACSGRDTLPMILATQHRMLTACRGRPCIYIGSPWSLLPAWASAAMGFYGLGSDLGEAKLEAVSAISSTLPTINGVLVCFGQYGRTHDTPAVVGVEKICLLLAHWCKGAF